MVPTSSTSKSPPSDENGGGGGDSAGREKKVPPLPIQVIERNRLSEAEIAALPRFKDHTPGEPSEVCDSVVTVISVD